MGHSADDAVHKIPHKMKMFWQNQLKIFSFNLKSSIELDIKKIDLSNAPFKGS